MSIITGLEEGLLDLAFWFAVGQSAFRLDFGGLIERLVIRRTWSIVSQSIYFRLLPEV